MTFYGIVKSGRDYRNEDFLAHTLADIRTEDNVRSGVNNLADEFGSLVDLVERHIFRTHYVKDNACCAFDRRFEQRTVDGEFNRVHSAFFASASADTHVSDSAVAHYGANVGKVEVDKRGGYDEIAYSLYALTKYVVGVFERLFKRHLRRKIHKFLVGNDNDTVNDLFKVCDTDFGVIHSRSSFEKERFGYDRDGKFTHFLGYARDNGSRAGAGAAAHTRGYEHEIRVFDCRGNGESALFGGLLTFFGIRARALSVRKFVADLNTGFGFGHTERLKVGVYGDKARAFNAGVDHTVYGVSAASAHAYYHDVGGHSEHIFIIVHD